MSHYLLAGRAGGLAPTDRIESLLATASPVLAMPGQRLGLRIVRPSVGAAEGAVVLAAWSPHDLPDGDADLLDHVHRTAGARIRPGPDGATLSTGVVASRTWWATSVGDVAVATTSLRLAAFLLGSVDVDPEAAAWMMASGTLGPSTSWDRRVRQIPPLASWRVPSGDVSLDPALPDPDQGSPGERAGLEARLAELVGGALAPVVAEPRRWILPLSGGVDSRGLAILAEGRLETITHGVRGSERDEWSDAAIAATISREFGWRNRFIAFGDDDATAQAVLDNFCRASECRIDHIGGYADGMASYEDLSARGITGLVRGDEVFGWNRRMTEFATRDSMGALLMADVRLPAGLAAELGPLARRQRPPLAMVRSGGQRLPVFRDRLYRAFRVPAVLAPLTEIKSCYVDVTTPLLDDDVVRFAAALPDELRTDKRFWSAFVASRSREIPYARHRSAPRLEDVLGRADVGELIAASVRSGEPERAGIPGPALDALARSARGTSGSAAASPARRIVGRATAGARRALPHRVRRELAIRRVPAPSVDRSHAMFRAYLSGRAVVLLEEAAAAGAAATDRLGPLAAATPGSSPSRD